MLHIQSNSRLIVQHPAHVNRTGTSIMECAITLPVLLFVLFSLLDLGIAATRYNALAEVSRRIAREAILHGSLAPDASGTWGPGEFTGTMADGSAMLATAHRMIPTMNGGDVTVHVTWPDNDNSPRDRVQVEVGYRHDPLIPAICPWGQIDLRSVATMHIVN
jgi:Flp pilus assembly protein TadG